MKTKHDSKTPYNGHKNFSYWNQALWLMNDKNLYNYAVDLCSSFSKDEAAQILFDEFKGFNDGMTPDGVKWTFSGIRAAIRGDF